MPTELEGETVSTALPWLWLGPGKQTWPVAPARHVPYRRLGKQTRPNYCVAPFPP